MLQPVEWQCCDLLNDYKHIQHLSNENYELILYIFGGKFGNGGWRKIVVIVCCKPWWPLFHWNKDDSSPSHVAVAILGWFSNRTGTSMATSRAAKFRIEKKRVESILFWILIGVFSARAVATDVPVLLLNQPSQTTWTRCWNQRQLFERNRTHLCFVQQLSTWWTVYFNIQHCSTHCSTFVDQQMLNRVSPALQRWHWGSKSTSNESLIVIADSRFLYSVVLIPVWLNSTAKLNS